MEREYKILQPQPGFQTQAASTGADIAVLGGVAGCGKTGSLLLEFLRHIEHRGWGGAIFRQYYNQINKEGGLWDTAKLMYGDLHPKIRPEFIDGKKQVRFPSGAKLTFEHLTRDEDLGHWQGTQIKYLAFDELSHFSAKQFFYMLSRNRGAGAKIDSYCRSSCNPVGHGWLKEFISWWLYPTDHDDPSLADYPIPERAGAVRYLARYQDVNIWGDSRQECYDNIPSEGRYSIVNPHGIMLRDIKTVTFIPGRLDDNKILLENDPGYRGNLLALDLSEQEQLMKGRWRSISIEDRQMFDFRATEDLFTNTFVAPGDRYLTCDIAMEGADKFVIFYWSGWRVEKIYVFEKKGGNEVLDLVKSIAEKHGVPRRNIAFDCDGVGNFMKGFLRTSLDYRGNASPIEVKGVKENYANLRSQCYYMAAQKVNDYEIYVAEAQHREIIGKELRATLKAEKRSDLKLRVIPKDEIKSAIGHSPDYADNFAMRMALELKKPPKRGGTSMA